MTRPTLRLEVTAAHERILRHVAALLEEMDAFDADAAVLDGWQDAVPQRRQAFQRRVLTQPGATTHRQRRKQGVPWRQRTCGQAKANCGPGPRTLTTGVAAITIPRRCWPCRFCSAEAGYAADRLLGVDRHA